MADLLRSFSHFAFGILSLEEEFAYWEIYQIAPMSRISVLCLGLTINLGVQLVF